MINLSSPNPGDFWEFLCMGEISEKAQKADFHQPFSFTTPYRCIQFVSSQRIQKRQPIAVILIPNLTPCLLKSARQLFLVMLCFGFTKIWAPPSPFKAKNLIFILIAKIVFDRDKTLYAHSGPADKHKSMSVLNPECVLCLWLPRNPRRKLGTRPGSTRHGRWRACDTLWLLVTHARHYRRGFLCTGNRKKDIIFQ